MSALVAYFSAEIGKTAGVGKAIAEAIGADLFEIRPEKPYTEADLNWRNPFARCNVEHATGKKVPVEGTIENFSAYDAVYIGFPIWYGCAPNVVDTFLEGYDWTGKTVYVFATSGGGGLGKTAGKLAPYLKGGEIRDAKLFRSGEEAAAWAKGNP